jgi:PTH1 family peptidyl-tRNA hydrolase
VKFSVNEEKGPVPKAGPALLVCHTRPEHMASNRLATGNPTTRVVVGLGNAERQYRYTRHNVGARAAAEALSRLGLKLAPGLVPVPMSRSGFVLPSGFMNDSGLIVLKAVERWRPMAAGLLVVHDDLDLEFGEVREREGGGHGGHNGLRDIVARLGTGAFRRLRIGIGRPPGSMDAADYVLGTFRPQEREAIDAAIDQAADIIVRFVEESNDPLSRLAKGEGVSRT